MKSPTPKQPPADAPCRRALILQHNYLHLPVKNGAPLRRVRLLLGEETVREFDMELAEEQPDFWVFADVSAYWGRRMDVVVEGLPKDSPALEQISQYDTPPASRLYKEPLRPQIHFSSRRGWNNDPNGLVFHQGEWHLFYQHNPYGWKWGNMHWGHAISPDLVHWRELGIALYPHQYGDWVFSGSAVVDERNTAGFRHGEEDVIVAVYTSTGRGECIAYSTDRGRTFTDYEGNPVVKHRGRDPKVFWYAPGEHWVMAVYDEAEENGALQRRIAFYTSPDLKRWEFQSRTEGDDYYECPELFELPLDGDPADTRWILYAADGSYAVGQFDGKRFTKESGKHPYNWGNCFYASQTFNNAPDGRRVQIAWGQREAPGMPFNQMMDFPVDLSLRTTEEGPRLFAWPVPEIERLYAGKGGCGALDLPDGDSPLAGITGELLDVSAEFTPGGATQVGLILRGVPVLYDAGTGMLSACGKEAPLPLVEGKVRLRLLADRTTLEVFGADGRIYMPLAAEFTPDAAPLTLSARGAGARLEGLSVKLLRSSWVWKGMLT